MGKKILVIDDNQFFRGKVGLVLEQAGYQVIQASIAQEGFRLIRQEKPDLVLVDLIMPGLDGFEVCRILRGSENYNLMPIIILTSRDSLEDKLYGLQLGADDYIVKPFDDRELLSRIRNLLRRIDRNRDANPLTGLPGNLEIQREITSRIAKAGPFAVIYADLDNFKSYNDIYGFAKGDDVIKLTAEILQDGMLPTDSGDDFLGHIGGDDFVIVTTPDKVPNICGDILKSFDDRIRDMFSPVDLERGYISSLSRRGEIENFPIMTISLAVVTNERHVFASHLQVSQIATELKKKLKTLPGSNYLIDRRTDTNT